MFKINALFIQYLCFGYFSVVGPHSEIVIRFRFNLGATSAGVEHERYAALTGNVCRKPARHRSENVRQELQEE